MGSVENLEILSGSPGGIPWSASQMLLSALHCSKLAAELIEDKLCEQNKPKKKPWRRNACPLLAALWFFGCLHMLMKRIGVSAYQL